MQNGGKQNQSGHRNMRQSKSQNLQNQTQENKSSLKLATKAGRPRQPREVRLPVPAGAAEGGPVLGVRGRGRG